MMEFLSNKKGELTTQQIITLIVVIVSFSVILFLLFRLNLGETTQDEVCRNSVVMKGNPLTPAGAVPLNCHRDYLCITEDGSCEGLTKPEILKVKDVNEVYERLAEEMTDCWWMFGEGRVNYVSSGFTKSNICSICSQILFDDSLGNLDGFEESFSKDNLYDFLANKKMSDGETSYSKYLFGVENINQLEKKESDQEGTITFGNLEIGKQYFVVMGITNEIGNTYKWIGGVVAGAGVISLFIPGVNFVTGAIFLSVGTVGGIGGEIVAENINPEILALTIEGRGIDNKFMAPTIVESNSEKFEALNCEEILTLA